MVRERLGVAVVGAGYWGPNLVRNFATAPDWSLRAVCDLDLARARALAHRWPDVHATHDLDEVLRRSDVDAVAVATPARTHGDLVARVLAAGKHVLVEKPLALTLADCDRIIAAQEASGRTLIVGHTHAFDPNIRAMREIVTSGELGRLGMILTFNYNDFLLRPHRDDEFVDERRGGIALNQVSHQIEMLRMIGGPVRTVRAHLGGLEPARKAHGHCAALLGFENGACASLTFSAYDFFDSDEFHHWIAEGGNAKPPDRQGSTRAAFRSRQEDRSAHGQLAFGQRALPDAQPFLPHFGVLIATCERGDVRLSPNGLIVHGLEGTTERGVERGFSRAGHGDALDALIGAVRHGRPCINDARWGKDTLQVLLALLQSSEEDREIHLSAAG